jgi:hypothetical protein
MNSRKRVYLTPNGNYWNYSKGLPFPSRKGIQTRWKTTNGRIITIRMNKQFPLIEAVPGKFVSRLNRFFGRKVPNAPSPKLPNRRIELQKQLNKVRNNYYYAQEEYQQMRNHMGKNWFLYLTNPRAKNNHEKKMRNIKNRMNSLRNQQIKIQQNIKNII